ncbi:GNAT family N-acetyltransferase [Paenibacillus sp. PR3]|uniref:GNAT family N-acetyltransferase n=1 Tax=Paenibacillus terricola TaxID=2763503 RepID=A0ABR8N3Q9_9BACL|nr:GNAT family N-acetyltransferase [Paenibacillus terricola]MBD3922171.1 GNAT family N-acetyltransferase [Paenibacillus terricola]
MISLTSYADTEVVKRLLAQCMWPDDDRIARELLMYQTEPTRILMGEEKTGELVGLIGVERTGGASGILKHIAVTPLYQRRNLARSMIEKIMLETGLSELQAETDKDAVGFYKRIGCRIESLGEKYPEVERFRCILKRE